MFCGQEEKYSGCTFVSKPGSDDEGELNISASDLGRLHVMSELETETFTQHVKD